jgi:hypothetical protein
MRVLQALPPLLAEGRSDDSEYGLEGGHDLAHISLRELPGTHLRDPPSPRDARVSSWVKQHPQAKQ